MRKFEFGTENETIIKESDKKKKNWNVCRCKQDSVSACINCSWNPKDAWQLWLRWIRQPKGREGGLNWGETIEGKNKA